MNLLIKSFEFRRKCNGIEIGFAPPIQGGSLLFKISSNLEMKNRPQKRAVWVEKQQYELLNLADSKDIRDIQVNTI